MALIPRAQETNAMTVSSPVPIRGSTSAGIQASSEADLGGNIAKLGGALIQHAQRQEDMSQSNAFEISKAQLQANYMTSMAEAEKQASPDGSDMVQKFNEISGPNTDKIKANGPTSKEYADRLAAVDEAMRTEMGAHATVTGLSMQEKSNMDGAIKIADTHADSVRANPSPAMVGIAKNSYGQYLDGLVQKGVFTPDHRTKLMNGFDEKLGLSAIEGMAIQGKYGEAVNYLNANQGDASLVNKLDPDQAKSIGLIDSKEAEQLKSQGKTYDIPILTKKDGAQLTPEMTAAMSAIDPLKKASMIEQMKGKAQAAGDLKVSELNANMSGFEFMAYHGGSVSDAQIAKLKQDINSNPALTPFARVRNMDAINTAVAANQSIKTMQTLPRDKWDSVINNFDSKVNMAQAQAAKYDNQMASAHSDLAVQANRMQAKERLQDTASKMIKAQETDAGGFSIESDPVLNNLFRGTKNNDPEVSQRFASQTLARQNYLGISKDGQSVLPNSEAEGIGATLKHLPNSEAAADYLKNLNAKWGPYYPKVLSEITGTDKDLAKYQALAYIPSAQQFGLVDAIKNKGAILDNFKNLEGHTEIHNTMSAVADKEMSQFSKSLLGGANDSSRIQVINGYKDAIMLKAKRDVVDSGKSPTEAVKTATDEVINSQFNFVPSNGAPILVPKTMNGQPVLPEQVSNFVNKYSDAESFKELNLQVRGDATGKYQANPDSFYRDLQDKGRWVTNSAQDGVKLMTLEMSGKLQPVFDKYGKQVEKKYSDIMMNPVKPKPLFIPGFKGGG